MPFKTERQRRFMWWKYPKAARAWEHGRETTPSQWRADPGRTKARGSLRERMARRKRKKS